MIKLLVYDISLMTFLTILSIFLILTVWPLSTVASLSNELLGKIYRSIVAYYTPKIYTFYISC